MAHFSNYEHDEFKDLKEKWQDAWNHYTGEYRDRHNIREYLFQKPRESNKAFEYRIQDSDIILHFPTAVDGLCGILFSKSDATEREWGELGDPEDEGSLAYSLKHNADGSGTNWEPLMKQVAIRQTVMHRLWGLVEGVEVSNGETLSEASVKLINPQSVVNWYPSKGNPTEVLVKEERDVRTSLTQEPDTREVFTHYTLDGWRRFYVETTEKNGETIETEVQLDSGEYTYWQSSKRKVRVLPIFRVEIPMPRFVGYLLAQKQNHIFNFKSARDFGSSILSFALLLLVGDKNEIKAIADNLEQGNNYLTLSKDASQSHSFISPPSDHLAEAGNILEKDVEHFYLNAFKEYGDAAQVTATQVRLESQSGIEAFLSLLVSSLDEFENQCLNRIMQVYFPNRPETWGGAYVKRSKNFQPEDIQEAIDNLKTRYFGDQPLPTTSEQKAQALQRILTQDGIASEDVEELQAIIENTIDPKAAETVSRIASYLSPEQLVRALFPNADEEKIRQEVERINTERGAIPNDGLGG